MATREEIERKALEKALKRQKKLISDLIKHDDVKKYQEEQNKLLDSKATDSESSVFKVETPKQIVDVSSQKKSSIRPQFNIQTPVGVSTDLSSNSNVNFVDIRRLKMDKRKKQLAESNPSLIQKDSPSEIKTETLDELLRKRRERLLAEQQALSISQSNPVATPPKTIVKKTMTKSNKTSIKRKKQIDPDILSRRRKRVFEDLN